MAANDGEYASEGSLMTQSGKYRRLMFAKALFARESWSFGDDEHEQ